MVLRDFEVRPEDILEASRRRRQQAYQNPPPFRITNVPFQDRDRSRAIRAATTDVVESSPPDQSFNEQEIVQSQLSTPDTPRLRDYFRGAFQDFAANPKEDQPTYYMPHAPQMERDPEESGFWSDLKWNASVVLDSVVRNVINPVVGVGASLFEPGVDAHTDEDVIDQLLDKYPRYRTYGYSGDTRHMLRQEVRELYERYKNRYMEIVPGDGEVGARLAAFAALDGNLYPGMPAITPEMQEHREREIQMEREIEWFYGTSGTGKVFSWVLSGEGRRYWRDADEIQEKLSTDPYYARYDDWKDSVGLFGFGTRKIDSWLKKAPVPSPFGIQATAQFFEDNRSVALWRHSQQYIRENAGLIRQIGQRDPDKPITIANDAILGLSPQDTLNRLYLYGEAHSRDHELAYGSQALRELLNVEWLVPYEKVVTVPSKLAVKGIKATDAWAAVGKDVKGVFNGQSYDRFLNLGADPPKDYGNGVTSRHVRAHGTPGDLAVGGLGDVYDLEDTSGIYTVRSFPDITRDAGRKRARSLQDKAFNFHSDNRVVDTLLSPMRAFSVFGQHYVGWRFTTNYSANVKRTMSEMVQEADRGGTAFSARLQYHLSVNKSHGVVPTFSGRSKDHPVFLVDKNQVIQNLPDPVARLLGESKYHVFDYLYEGAIHNRDIRSALKQYAPDMYNFIERRKSSLAIFQEVLQNQGLDGFYSELFNPGDSPYVVGGSTRLKTLNAQGWLKHRFVSPGRGPSLRQPSIKDLIDDGAIFLQPSDADANLFRFLTERSADELGREELARFVMEHADDPSKWDLIEKELAGFRVNRATRARIRDNLIRRARDLRDQERPPETPPAPPSDTPPTTPPDAPPSETPTEVDEPEEVLGGSGSRIRVTNVEREGMGVGVEYELLETPEVIPDEVLIDADNPTTLLADAVGDPLKKGTVQLGNSAIPVVEGATHRIEPHEVWLIDPSKRMPLEAISFRAESGFGKSVEILSSMISAVKEKMARAPIDALSDNFVKDLVLHPDGYTVAEARIWGTIEALDAAFHNLPREVVTEYWKKQRQAILGRDIDVTYPNWDESAPTPPTPTRPRVSSVGPPASPVDDVPPIEDVAPVQPDPAVPSPPSVVSEVTENIEFRHGDILDTALLGEVQALVNPVNTVGVMGKGLAKQFRDKYKDSAYYSSYQQAIRDGDLDIGKVRVFKVRRLRYSPSNVERSWRAAHGVPPVHYVVDFPTKADWRQPSQMSYIVDGLKDLKEQMARHSIRSIAIPALGSGLGGLRWADVKAEIVKQFSGSGFKVVVYESPTPPAQVAQAPVPSAPVAIPPVSTAAPSDAPVASPPVEDVPLDLQALAQISAAPVDRDAWYVWDNQANRFTEYELKPGDSLELSSPAMVLGKMDDLSYSVQEMYKNVVSKYKRMETGMPTQRLPVAFKEISSDIEKFFSDQEIAAEWHQLYATRKTVQSDILRAADAFEHVFYLMKGLGQIDPQKYIAPSRSEIINKLFEYFENFQQRRLDELNALDFEKQKPNVYRHDSEAFIDVDEIFDYLFSRPEELPKVFTGDAYHALQHDIKNRAIHDKIKELDLLEGRAHAYERELRDAYLYQQGLLDPSEVVEEMRFLNYARTAPRVRPKSVVSDVKSTRGHDAEDVVPEKESERDAYLSQKEDDFYGDTGDFHALRDEGFREEEIFYDQLKAGVDPTRRVQEHERLFPDLTAKDWERGLDDWVDLVEDFFKHDMVGDVLDVDIPIRYDAQTMKTARPHLLHAISRDLLDKVSSSREIHRKAARNVFFEREMVDVANAEIKMLQDLIAAPDLEDFDGVLQTYVENSADPEMFGLNAFTILNDQDNSVLRFPFPLEAKRSTLRSILSRAEARVASSEKRYEKLKTRMDSSEAEMKEAFTELRVHSEVYADENVMRAFDKVDETNAVLTNWYKLQESARARLDYLKSVSPPPNETVDDFFGGFYRRVEKELRGKYSDAAGSARAQEWYIADLERSYVPDAPPVSEAVLKAVETQVLGASNKLKQSHTDINLAKNGLIDLLDQSLKDVRDRGDPYQELLNRHGIQVLPKTSMSRLWDADPEIFYRLLSTSRETLEAILRSWDENNPPTTFGGDNAGFPEFSSGYASDFFESKEWQEGVMGLQAADVAPRKDAYSTVYGRGIDETGTSLAPQDRPYDSPDKGLMFEPDRHDFARIAFEAHDPSMQQYADSSRFWVNTDDFKPQLKPVDWVHLGQALADLPSGQRAGVLGDDDLKRLVNLSAKITEADQQLIAVVERILHNVGAGTLSKLSERDGIFRNFFVDLDANKPVPASAVFGLIGALNDSGDNWAQFFRHVDVDPDLKKTFGRILGKYIRIKDDFKKLPNITVPELRGKFANAGIPVGSDYARGVPASPYFGWEEGHWGSVGNPDVPSPSPALRLSTLQELPSPEVAVYDTGFDYTGVTKTRGKQQPSESGKFGKEPPVEEQLPNVGFGAKDVSSDAVNRFNDDTRSGFFQETDYFGKLSPFANFPILLPGSESNMIVNSLFEFYEFLRWSAHPGVQKEVASAGSGKSAREVSGKYQIEYGPQNIDPQLGMEYAARVLLAQHFDRLAPMLLEARFTPEGAKKRIHMLGNDGFWGSRVNVRNNEMVGTNLMGRIWERLADQLRMYPKEAFLSVPAPSIKVSPLERAGLGITRRLRPGQLNPDGSIKEPVLVNTARGAAIDRWIGSGPNSLYANKFGATPEGLEKYRQWVANNRATWRKPAEKNVKLSRAQKVFNHVVKKEHTNNWTKPIDRNTKWGNPFHLRDYNYDREKVVNLHQQDLNHKIRSGQITIEELADLGRPVDGKQVRLSCHCSPLLCHGHTLMRYSLAAQHSPEALERTMAVATTEWYNRLPAETKRVGGASSGPVKGFSDEDLAEMAGQRLGYSYTIEGGADHFEILKEAIMDAASNVKKLSDDQVKNPLENPVAIARTFAKYSDEGVNTTIFAAENELVSTPAKRLRQVFAAFESPEKFLSTLAEAAREVGANPFRNAKSYTREQRAPRINHALLLTGDGNKLDERALADAARRGLYPTSSSETFAAKTVAENLARATDSVTTIYGHGATSALGSALGVNNVRLLYRTPEGARYSGADIGRTQQGKGLLNIPTSQERRTGALMLATNRHAPVLAASGDWNTLADTARAILLGHDVYLARTENPLDVNDLLSQLKQSPLDEGGDPETLRQGMLEAIALLGRLSPEIWDASAWRDAGISEDLIGVVRDLWFDQADAYMEAFSDVSLGQNLGAFNEPSLSFGSTIGAFENTPELDSLRLLSIYRDLGDGIRVGSLPTLIQRILQGHPGDPQSGLHALRAQESRVLGDAPPFDNAGGRPLLGSAHPLQPEGYAPGGDTELGQMLAESRRRNQGVPWATSGERQSFMKGGHSVDSIREFLTSPPYVYRGETFGDQSVPRGDAFRQVPFGRNEGEYAARMRAPGRRGLRPPLESREFVGSVPSVFNEINARRKNRLMEWQFLAGRTSRLTPYGDSPAMMRELFQMDAKSRTQGGFSVAKDPVGVAKTIAEDAEAIAKTLDNSVLFDRMSNADRELAQYVLGRLSEEMRLLRHQPRVSGGAVDTPDPSIRNMSPFNEMGDEITPEEAVADDISPSQAPEVSDVEQGHSFDPSAGSQSYDDDLPLTEYELDYSARQERANASHSELQDVERQIAEETEKIAAIDKQISMLEDALDKRFDNLSDTYEAAKAKAEASGERFVPIKERENWYLAQRGVVLPEEEYKAWARYNTQGTAAHKIQENLVKWIVDPAVRLQTAFDMGVFADQIGHLVLKRPADLPHYFRLMFHAFVKPTIFQEFLVQNEELLAEMAKYGVEIRPSEVEVFRNPGSDYVASNSGRKTAFQDIADVGFEVLNDASIDLGAKMWSKGTGVLAGTSRRFQTMFDMLLVRHNAARWLAESPAVRTRSLEYGLDVEAELIDFAQSLNRQSMVMSNTFAGNTPMGGANRRLLLAFSPTQMLSSLTLIADLFKKGPNKRASAIRLASNLVSLVSAYMLISFATGQKPKLNPMPKENGGDGADAFTIRIGDTRYGMQSSIRWIAKLGGGLFKDAITWNNPRDTIASALHERMSPALNMPYSFVKQRRFDGTAINDFGDKVEEFAKNYVPFFIEDLFFDADARNGGGLRTATLDFLGGDVRDVSTSVLIRDEEDRLASAHPKSGGNWANTPQLVRNEILRSPEAERLHSLYDEASQQRSASAVTNYEKRSIDFDEEKQQLVRKLNDGFVAAKLDSQWHEVISEPRADGSLRPIKFTRVKDADTVVVELDGQITTVRLQDVNAPEIPGEPGTNYLTQAEKDDLGRQVVTAFMAAEQGQYSLLTSGDIGAHGRLLGDIISPSGKSLQDLLIERKLVDEVLDYRKNLLVEELTAAEREAYYNGSGMLVEEVHVQTRVREMDQMISDYWSDREKLNARYSDVIDMKAEEIREAWARNPNDMGVRAQMLREQYIHDVLFHPSLEVVDGEFPYHAYVRREALFAERYGQDVLNYVKALQRDSFNTRELTAPNLLREKWAGIDAFGHYFQLAEDKAVEHAARLGIVDEDLVRAQLREYAGLNREERKDYLAKTYSGQKGGVKVNQYLVDIISIKEAVLKNVRKDPNSPESRDFDVFGYRMGWWELSNPQVTHTKAEDHFSFSSAVTGIPYTYDRVDIKDTTLSRGQ